MQVGSRLRMDAEEWVVRELSGASALCEREGEEDREDMRAIPVADVAALVRGCAGGSAGEYRPSPDVRLAL